MFGVPPFGDETDSGPESQTRLLSLIFGEFGVKRAHSQKANLLKAKSADKSRET